MIADPTFDPFLPIITGMEQTDPSPAENFEMESVLWYCPRHSSWGYQLSILLSMWQLGPFVSHLPWSLRSFEPPRVPVVGYNPTIKPATVTYGQSLV